jgi:hemerythrin
MTWNNEYSVHIELVDDQHKKLIGLINGLHDAMKVGKGKEALGKTLSELVDYTAYHFKEEEELFKAYAYPDYLSHKKEHDALTKQAVDLKERFTRGDLFLSNETVLFLKDWLNGHILGSDKKYGPYLNAKGVS